jgi:hypothetical protein
MQKWEYVALYYQDGNDPQYQGWNIDGKILSASRGLSARSILNTMGAEGWELVSALYRDDERYEHFYLKRPLQ